MKLKKPTKDQVRSARLLADQTQDEAASTVHLANYKTWQNYELGDRNMSLATWELYLIKNFILKNDASEQKKVNEILKKIG